MPHESPIGDYEVSLALVLVLNRKSLPFLLISNSKSKVDINIKNVAYIVF